MSNDKLNNGNELGLITGASTITGAVGPAQQQTNVISISTQQNVELNFPSDGVSSIEIRDGNCYITLDASDIDCTGQSDVDSMPDDIA